MIRHIIPISGKDSLATALVQTAIDPNLPYEYIFNDTKAELPETYEWLNRVEEKTGWTITRIEDSLENRIVGKNGYLPSIQSRYCTQKSKIEPTDKYLAGDRAIIYYGLRADEERMGYVPSGSSKIKPVNPLKDKGLTLAHVYAILQAQDLTPPDFFWKKLYDAVLEGCPKEEWLYELEPWQVSRLFSGRSRANCYFCFFQRQVEFLWLYEVHHDFFEKARNFEKTSFTWLKDCPLSKYDDIIFRAKVFWRQVNKITNVLQGEGKVAIDSEIAKTSCGLICGK